MSSAIAWHLPLIAVGVGFHLSVSWALLWRYFQARERSLLTWGIAWLVLSLHVLGMFLTQMGLGPGAQALRDLSFAAASIALFAGQVERQGRWLQPSARTAANTAIVVGLSVVAGMAIGKPLTAASATLSLMALGGAAWLGRPSGNERHDAVRWLISAAYVAGAARGLIYMLPLDAHYAVPVEISGHAIFSLLFSAAVTYQAWEHERALRYFSRTLERLNRPLSLQSALDESLKLVAEALGVVEGWIILREEGRGNAQGRWTIGAALGFPEWAKHGLNGAPFPIDTCLCLRPIDPDVLVTTLRDLPCVRASIDVGHASGRHVTIPLGSDGEVQGIMSLLIPPGRLIDAGLIDLLTALGEQIGLAIDRARVYDELRAKEEVRGRILSQLITAQEDERRRIARELHDETGQALTALVVNLDFLVRNPVDDRTLRMRLSSVRDMAEATLAEVRRVIHEMRPSVLDDLGLEAAVRWLVRRYEPSGLQVSVEFCGGAGRLPGPLEITVFRLVQEACTNTVKHAAARRLWVKVTQSGQWLTVEVGDDGRGIGPSNTSSGMGLTGLKERVALMGGTLRVASTPGEGTVLQAELPLGAAGVA